jgi:hypothetical protein
MASQRRRSSSSDESERDERAAHLERLHVDVRLVEAVEEHHAVRPSVLETAARLASEE